jgi:phospholipase C
VSDLNDPEYAERLAFEAPDEALRRRDFLQRLAVGAGAAATLGTVLDPEVLLAEAARRQRRVPLPKPRNLPIDTFVVLMMENRSFDHYLGWLPGADARNAGLSYMDRLGNTRGTARLAPDFQGCAHPDPDHSWDGGREQLNGGLMDGFLRAGDNDEFAIGYYAEEDLPFIGHVAKAFTTYDRFFCSLLASTWPNRYYKWSAQSGGLKNNDPPVGTAGNQWETIFDRAIGRGVSARYYASDLPFSAVWGPRGATWTNPITRFYADCAAGTLPNIAFVDPPFRDGGGGDGLSADEHPLGDVRLGQAFMADVVNAFVSSPSYRRGALFVIYDEWGGFFDHVTPPHVPDDRSSADLYEDFGQMGFRIPALAVSPFARGKSERTGFRVDHGLYGHESILKLISYRFGLGDLTLRQSAARNIGLSFDWEHPSFDAPTLPDPPEVATAPCSLGGGDVLDSQAAHASDLAALEALAERNGVPSYEGKLGDIFTLPDTMRQAVLSR